MLLPEGRGTIIVCVLGDYRLFQDTAGPFPASADVDVRGGGGEAAGNNPLCSFHHPQ